MARRIQTILIGVALIGAIAMVLRDLPLSARPLFWLLRDVDRGDVVVASRALQELGKRAGDNVISELITRLELGHQRSWDISKALGAIGQPVVAPLTALLERGSPAAQLSAVSALGFTARESAFAPLARSVSNGSSELRRSAVIALATVPGDATEQLLLHVVKDDNEDLAYAAASSLSRRKSVASLTLIDDLCDRLKDGGRRSECVKYIDAIDGSAAVGLLAARLGKETSSYVRWEIAKALARVDDTRASAALDAAAAAKQLEVIAGAYPYFLRAAPPLDDQLLADAYLRLGAADMAKALLESQRPALISAVRQAEADPVRRPKLIEAR
jgi:HEAT repeat protein